MKSVSMSIAASALVLALSAALVPAANAHLSNDMVERSLSNNAQVVDGHLHLMSKKSAVQASYARHRRHHAKFKRSTCSSSSSSSSSADDDDDDSSSASSASGSSSSSASTTASTRKASSTGSSTSSSSSSASSSSSSSSDDDVSPISSNSTSSSSGSSTSASSLGSITGFSGTNTGIGSWFRTDSSQDSTNGRSWCQLNYKDTWMGFAPSVGTMLDNFGDSTEEAGKAYCGREAKATNPSNGNTALIYIVDGFDDAWVKTPGSVDLTVAAFTALYGSFDGNKDTVISGLEWEFTGNVNEAYTFDSSS